MGQSGPATAESTTIDCGDGSHAAETTTPTGSFPVTLTDRMTTSRFILFGRWRHDGVRHNASGEPLKLGSHNGLALPHTDWEDERVAHVPKDQRVRGANGTPVTRFDGVVVTME